MTKKYTLNLLISEVSSLRASNVTSVATLANAISPRAGTKSAKIRVLNSFLGGSLASVISGKNTKVTGRSGRTRLLNALRARKAHSF